MNKYYEGKIYQSVGVVEARGAQQAPYETDQIPPSPNSSVPEQEVRRCVECGTVLKDKRQYIICWVNKDFQPMCKGCYCNVSSEKDL